MIPGTILVIDDKEGEVKELVTEFVGRGENAFFTGFPFEHQNCESVRLLIFDYYLFEDSEKDSLETISEIINIVFQKSKFLLVAVWSARIDSTNQAAHKKNIEEAYFSRFNTSLPCILLDPMGKAEVGYAGLIKKIETEICSHPDLNLIYEAEKIVDAAKTKVGTQIYEIGSWSALIKEIGREYNIDSIERNLLSIYLNMMEKSSELTPEFKKCVEKIKQIVKTDPLKDIDFAKVYSTQYYHKVSEEEQTRSGDILFHEKSNKYYIIITPECDIVHNKHTTTKVVEGKRIDHTKLTDADYVKKICGEYKLFESDGKTIDYENVISSLMNGGFVHGVGGFKANFGRLLFLRENTEFYHLIFDFHKVLPLKKAKKLSELKDFKRCCRVDDPLLNSFIQQYASHCTRFGTMSIPRKIAQSISSKLPRKDDSSEAS